MLEAVRDFHELTGVAHRGEGRPAASARPRTRSSTSWWCTRWPDREWLTPDLFRFGASSLLNDVLMQRHKQLSGRYDGADYVDARLMTRRPRPRHARPGSTPRRPRRAISSPSSRRYGLFIGGEFVAPRDGTLVQDGQPGHRGGAGRGRRRRPGRRRRRRGRRPPGPARVGPAARRRSGPSTSTASPAPSRSGLARAGRAGVDRQRQADQGDPRRRPAPRRGPLLLLRRLGRQAGLRRATARTRSPSACAARSSRGTSRC